MLLALLTAAASPTVFTPAIGQAVPCTVADVTRVREPDVDALPPVLPPGGSGGLTWRKARKVGVGWVRLPSGSTAAVRCDLRGFQRPDGMVGRRLVLFVAFANGHPAPSGRVIPARRDEG